MNNKQEFIEKTLGMTEGITGFNLCTYLLGLEGWRRGLSLTYYNKIDERIDFGPKKLNYFGRLYSLSSKHKTHYFFQSRGDTTTREAVSIAREKESTKEFLKKENLPIIDGESFSKEIKNDEIKLKAQKIGYPLIVKPSNGSLSKGVIIDIQNEEELDQALKEVRENLGYKSIIVERYFQGEDIRMYVIEDEVVAAIKRIPASVTGDGIHTIEQLISLKNKSREQNPYLKARPIKINKETKSVLKKQNLFLNYVLEKDTTILVKKKSTLTQGVDLEDITDTIPETFKQVAIKSINAIPGLKHASVDMLSNGREVKILEVNSSANISMHLFPTRGKSRNVPAAIVDYYFPETIKNRYNNQQMNFDYSHLLKTLKENYTDYITLRSLKEEEMKPSKYLITGENFSVRILNFIVKKALSRRINGHVKLVDKNEIELVCATYKPEEIDWLKRQIRKYKKSKVKVNSINSKFYQGVVNIGFTKSL